MCRRLLFCRISALAPSFCRICNLAASINASLQLALSRSDKMLCEKTEFFSAVGILIHNSQFIIDNARKWKFSGGNSCVPSVASERGSNVKFPIFSQPNSCVPLVASDQRSSAEIRQNWQRSSTERGWQSAKAH